MACQRSRAEALPSLRTQDGPASAPREHTPGRWPLGMRQRVGRCRVVSYGGGMDELRQLGVNLRRIRLRQGMTLDVLAGQSGLSKSFLSRVENGHRTLERRKDLSAVSEALGCTIADLVGQPVPPIGSAQQEVHAAVPRCGGRSTPKRDRAPGGDQRAADRRSAPSGREPVVGPARVRSARGLARPARAVADLHAHTVHGREPREAHRLLVEVTSAAAFALKGLGYTDLAWIAAETCLTAAHEHGDPAGVGLAEYTRAQAATFGHGYAGALHIAETAADESARSSVTTPTTCASTGRCCSPGRGRPASPDDARTRSCPRRLRSAGASATRARPVIAGRPCSARATTSSGRCRSPSRPVPAGAPPSLPRPST